MQHHVRRASGSRSATGSRRASRKFGINDRRRPSIFAGSRRAASGPTAGTFQNNKPFFALGAIGQGNVAVTPLQMALVAESVADDGVMLVPHVMDEIRASDGTVVRRYDPKVWQTDDDARHRERSSTSSCATSSPTPNGTGTAARIPGITVAGKTGTAEAPGGPPHAWFIAFAPAEAPRYAIAVIVERGGDLGSEATGGKVAAPVAARSAHEPAEGPGQWLITRPDHAGRNAARNLAQRPQVGFGPG